MTATLSRSETKNMYSWWWDSHISPKNSKWLQENLTDMDINVKSMIKIIEVDEDTFARRADMYFKKRPELMKLVEEFYRAYRALAERYDHATGVIRQAHKTMAEAFPNQVPFLMTDDGPGPVNPAHDSDPRTPEMLAPPRAIADFEELQKGAVGLSSTESLSGKEFKQLNGIGKARKGLNFRGIEEKGDIIQNNQKHQMETQVLTESERIGRSEGDIQALKDSLANLESEKEAGLLEYKKTLERLSKLESDFSQAKEDSKEFNFRANKAEGEVQSLKELLANVEAEKEATLAKYRQCLDKISNLEGDAEHMNDELSRVKAEKEALLAKYMEALEKLANLENKLLLAEDYASRTTERAERAEKEIDALKETIERLTKDKEVAVLKYEQSLEKIATLESEIIVIQVEAERLKAEVQIGVDKIKESAEMCLLLDSSNKSLQSEVDSLGQKVGIQNQELSEKQRELGRLWTCVQEERMRFVDVEAGFQSLQNLHSKVQEELRSVANELQKKVQLLKELENQNQQLEDQVQKVKDENLSSTVSMESMRKEILGLKDGKEKLEHELEIRLEQRNALQAEIYCLKEEVNNLSLRHEDLQDENVKLQESCHRSSTEISTLVEKLGVMDRLVKKNEILENSLSDLSAELEAARGKVEELEESCKLLIEEKFTLGTDKGNLISQLQLTTENLERLSQRNTLLENTLFDVNAELEMLRLKSQNLEDSCKLLNDQNALLASEKKMLVCELDLTRNRLEDLGKRHVDLEERYSILEEERKSTLKSMEDLHIYLASEKQEHTTSMADLENKIRQLQVEGDHMREELEQELDNVVNAQFEIFILYKCINDLKENNFSLLGFCKQLLDAKSLSEKLISELEKDRFDQQDVVKALRMGIFGLLNALEDDVEPLGDGYSNEDQRVIYLIREKLYDIQASLSDAWDENQELVVQKSILVEVIRQLKQDVLDLNSVVHAFKQEIETRDREVILQQKETQKLLESNEELILKVREGNMKEALLLTQVENLQEKLLNLQKAYDGLQNEHFRVVEGNKSLIFTIKDLEDERSCMVEEVIELDNLSVIFKNIISENSRTVVELSKNIEKLCHDNDTLEDKVRNIEKNLDDARTQNTIFENELEEVRVANDQLKGEVVNGRDLLGLKEVELLKILKEHEECEALVRALSSELQKGKDEVTLWETVAGAFFSELQSSSVREALIKEKFAELVKAYEALEDESYSKCMDLAQLRERVGALECENSEIKARLAADLSAIVSLKDSVESLEKHAISFKKLQQGGNGEKEELKSSQDLNESQSGEFVNLHIVQARIQDVEKAIIELKQHAEEEYSGVRSDLDSALRQIEGLKSQSNSRRGSSGRLSRRFPSQPGDESKQRSGPDTFEPGEVLLMKDIVLDQASDCSSYGKTRKVMESNDQILEIWQTLDQSGSIDLTVGKTNKYAHMESVKENKSGRPSSESLVEREVGVDEQLSSRRFRNPQAEDNKRKTLERLASDVQKLTNLQITVRDLKEKLEMSESSVGKGNGKGKVAETEGVKEQLEESEQMILKLFDYSAKVMKNIENATSTSSSMSFDGLSMADLSDGSARRKKSMDQARRISEKIGRLQLEVQKIQFFLMKLDNNNKAGKGGTRIVERSTRVLLRDYLYGGTRTPRRRKKTHFCGCVQPATKGSD